MRNPFRTIAAVIAGMGAGVLVIAAAEALSARVYPPPPGLDPNDADAFTAYVAQLPLGAFLLVLAGWGAGSFIGTWLATRIGPRDHFAAGLIVGAVLLAAGIANMFVLPHPVWFRVAAIVVFAGFSYAGTRLGAHRT